MLLNTHNSSIRIGCALTEINLIAALVVNWFAVPATATNPNPRPPMLQRARVLDSRTYVLDFDVPRGPLTPALLELDNDSEESSYYYLFGIAQTAICTNCSLTRWDVTDAVVFATYEFPIIHQRTGPVLFRYPRSALISRADGRDCLDRSNLGPESNLPGGLPAPNYIGIAPIRAAYMAFDGWKIGDEPIQDGLHVSSKGIPVIHYDIRALNDVQIELYMTLDGKLSKWLYDGVKWTLREEFTVEIEGPFFVRGTGSSLVAERNGEWCVIGPLDAEDPEVIRIIEKDAKQPLFLIEDMHAKKDYFSQGNRLMDDRGRVIGNINAFAAPDDQLREVVERVVSRRAE